MENTTKFKLAIILYDSRSGSTYLSSLLNQYKGIEVALESSFPRIILEFPKSLVTTNLELDILLNEIYKEKQFQDMRIPREKMERELTSLPMPLNKKVIFEVILRNCFEDKYNQLDKSKTFILKIPIAHEYLFELNFLIPGYKIIHIIRDGRAVFSSKRNSISLRKMEFETNLLVAAKGWKHKLKLAAKSEQQLINVFYEKLILQPEETLNSILDFLNIDSDGRQKTKKVNQFSDSISPEQKKFHTNIGKAPLIENLEKWKRDIVRRDIILYEFIAGNFLKLYGYDILYYRGFLSCLSPLLLSSLFYSLEYLKSRARNISHHLRNGNTKGFLRRKLIQKGLIKVKV